MAHILGKLQILQVPICAQSRNFQLCLQERLTLRKISAEIIFNTILQSYKMVFQII